MHPERSSTPGVQLTKILTCVFVRLGIINGTMLYYTGNRAIMKLVLLALLL